MTDRPPTPLDVLDVDLGGPATIAPLPPPAITLEWNDKAKVTIQAADVLDLPDRQFRAIVIAAWTSNIEQEPIRSILRELLPAEA